MGGNRVSTGRWVFNILTVWMLTGLWHGAAWNFVIWGLFFGVFLMAEKWMPGLQKLPDILRHSYVLLAIILSFVLFNADSISMAASDIGGLFGLAHVPLVTASAVYYLKSYSMLLLMGVAGCTPAVKQVAVKIGSSRVGPVLEAILLAGLLLVCTAYLVDGSFSPFLYFRF
jgi:alginate O-acetyltransferase complex protein AlgI